jgi:hypothetical protein
MTETSESLFGIVTWSVCVISPLGLRDSFLFVKTGLPSTSTRIHVTGSPEGLRREKDRATSGVDTAEASSGDRIEIGRAHV